LSLAKNLDLLSFDERFINERRQIRSEKPTGLIGGITSGFYLLLLSFFQKNDFFQLLIQKKKKKVSKALALMFLVE